MRISAMAIDRSTTVLVLMVLIVVAGVYSYTVLPRESAPEVVIPFISIATTYEGVSAEDIETLVTMPIERKLTGLDNVKRLESTSSEGASMIVVEFMANTDIDASLQNVRDKVDQAKPDLPDEADEPMVSEINIGELPIIFISLSGDIGIAALSRIAEDLEDDIEEIPGVLSVQSIGKAEREIQIVGDPERIAQYGISMSDLIQLIQLENVNTPSGSMDLGEAKYSMRVPGEFRTVEEITGLVVRRGPEGTVYMRDIAEVRDGFKERTSLSRVNGRPNITLTVAKRSGENIIAMADAVKELVDTRAAELPAGIELSITYDESNYVREIVTELESSILSGLILVLIIIFLAMGAANAVFVALAIPLSMLIVFSFLFASGITLNMVVLFSLTLSLGMLVDNGIVVVENIYRYVECGVKPIDAAKKGAAEVAYPVTAATLTTIAAFSPMLFWPGIWGEFMKYLPMTVIACLLGSLFVALVVNPTLASRFMRVRRKDLGHVSADIEPQEAIPTGRIYTVFERFLRTALHYRIATMTAAFTVLGCVLYIFMAAGMIIDEHGNRIFEPSRVMEFTPDIEPSQANVEIKAPPGTNLETSDRLVRRVEAIVEPVSEHLRYTIANVGTQGVSLMGFGESATNVSRVTLVFHRLADMTVPPSTIVSDIRHAFDDIPGAEFRVETVDNSGPPMDPPVNVEISGDDFATLAEIAAEVENRIRDVEGLVDLRNDYDRGVPEVRVDIDRQQAWELGLNTRFIGEAVKAAINGIVAGKYREGEDEYDVIVRFPDSFREDLSNLENMTLVNLEGDPIPFSAVARLQQDEGLGSIRRIDRKRTITVMADVEGRTGPAVLADVQRRLAAHPLPPGYSFNYTGENEDTEETQEFLSRAFVVALFLIALVLVTQFNSIFQPFIIMTSVILSLAGVFLGLTLFNMPFGILMTGIGCISLAGVVVNNAIVLLDFINKLRARGQSVEEAIVHASLIRFRPVLLTAITTILGLIPMASGISFNFRTMEWMIGGESTQWWGPMAIAVIFGLAFATMLTLVVVPTLYSILYAAADRIKDAVPAERGQESAA